MAGNPGQNTKKIIQTAHPREEGRKAAAPDTPKREKDREVSGNNDTYRLIVEKATQGIFVAQDGKLQFVNAPLAKFSTYSEKELFSSPFTKFIHPDDREMVLGNYQRRLRGEKAPSGYAFRVVDKDGKTRWLEIRSIEISWKSRPATLNFISDITKRMQAEEALRKSEDRFKRVAENTGEWIWEVDVNGLYTYSSPAVEKILGYKPEELVGKKSFFEMFGPEEGAGLKKMMLEDFKNRETIRHFINTNIHKEGYPVILETNAAPILDREGNLLGYQGVDTDITEQKQAEELYRTLTESSQVGIYIIQGGKFLFANARFREYFREDSH